MRKFIIFIIVFLTVLLLCGCDSKKEYTARDVADSISDISTDIKIPRSVSCPMFMPEPAARSV